MLFKNKTYPVLNFTFFNLFVNLSLDSGNFNPMDSIYLFKKYEVTLIPSFNSSLSMVLVFIFWRNLGKTNNCFSHFPAPNLDTALPDFGEIYFGKRLIENSQLKYILSY